MEYVTLLLWGCACASPRGLGSWGSSLASVSCSLKTVCPGKLVTFLLWGRYLGTEGSLYCVGSSSGCLPCPAALRPLPGWSVSAAGHWFRAPVLGSAWAVSLWVLSTPAHGALSFVLLHFCRFDAGVTHTGLSCPGPWYEAERLTGQNHRHKLEPGVPFPHQAPTEALGVQHGVWAGGCAFAPWPLRAGTLLSWQAFPGLFPGEEFGLDAGPSSALRRGHCTLPATATEDTSSLPLSLRDRCQSHMGWPLS